MAVSFGTSGLRGPAVSFDGPCIDAYICAFLDHIGAVAGQEVFLGCDLRRSSPDISAHAFAAITAHGQTPIWAGVVPTPALAAAGLGRNAPAIVITGSHIPEDYNGIKFYRADGELLKQDEAPIAQRAAEILDEAREIDVPPPLPTQAESFINTDYIARYLSAFGTNALCGLKLGLFKHSAAGRDALETIFSGLGAEVTSFGQTDTFVAIDTEALDPKSVTLCADMISTHGLDAVISSDGDGDRPLLIGPNGQQINGDVLCTLAARALGIGAVVTPLTSTTAIELSGWFGDVIRTKIGSPYVVDAMAQSDADPIVGFEANGGLLLGSDLVLAHGPISALPTRDAVLPLVAVLVDIIQRETDLPTLVDGLPSRTMKADRIKQVPGELSARFLAQIASDAELRGGFWEQLATPRSVDLTDGVRIQSEAGTIVHFRASGNAPELRLYVEADNSADATQLLNTLMPKLAQCLNDMGLEMGLNTDE